MEVGQVSMDVNIDGAAICHVRRCTVRMDGALHGKMS